MRPSWAACLLSIGGCLPLEPTRPSPVIETIQPGSAAPGQVLAIMGSHFGPQRGGSVVMFGDVAAADYEEWTESQIRAVVPQTNRGRIEVVVDVEGLRSEPAPFTVLSAPVPVITSIDPPGEMPGTVVTISGSAFGEIRLPGNTVVFAMGVDAGESVTNWSDVAIEVTIPAGAVSGGVVVRASGQQSDPFFYAVGGTGPTLTDVQGQVFTPHCATSQCHDVATARAGLVLASGLSYANLVNVPSRQRPAILRVAPGDPDGSYLYLKIALAVPPEGDRMPQGLPPLSAGLIALVRDWISAGAAND